MNIYDKSLAAADELFSTVTAEELEKDYLLIRTGNGITVEEYLVRRVKLKSQIEGNIL
jgi:myo-inositol-hexaphosphate 3-phosphohydrolase